ncbi:37S ribosomal protein S4-like protein [Grifola frondosa]|uniref:37S ribosomal protein S4-like protein n=1 Tax=Grifola frondosa TaxID=5627 RepID=A0A1C7MKQ5_GRIFR|nr:37S ribosomal protein S4-like protein [Grifola frondosa]
MRDANLYGIKRALPRMSWHPRNLFNLWQRSIGPKKDESDWKDTSDTLFQQRWKSKALVRAYHGDFINEKIFKRWYLPSTLPDVRSDSPKAAAPSIGLNRWALKDKVADREQKRLEAEQTKGLAPVGSMMFMEVERRVDVFIFRACFAHSVYEARRMVIHGDVLLNGRKHTNPNTRLAPGDMISVDPKAIRFLQASAAPKEEEEVKEVKEETKPEEVAASEAEETSETDLESNSEESLPEQNVDSSLQEKPNAQETPRPAKQKRSDKYGLTPFYLPPYASPFIFIPAYIEPSFATCSAIYLRHPTARPGYSEIPTPFDADGDIVRLAWEWYGKRRTHMRSKRQLARMPENRQVGDR